MTFVEKKIRAVFNRLDAEPGATQRHSKNLPVSPLRKGGKKDQTPPTFPPLRGKKDQTPPTFPPLRRGVGGVEHSEVLPT